MDRVYHRCFLQVLGLAECLRFLWENVLSRNGLFFFGLSFKATRTVGMLLCGEGCVVGRYLTVIRMHSRTPRGLSFGILETSSWRAVGGVQGGFQTCTQQGETLCRHYKGYFYQ